MARVLSVLAAALLLAAPACSSTGSTVTDEATAAALPTMTWSEVASAVDSGAVLIDARGAESFNNGHITGAVNVPSRGDDAKWANLPTDKATKLITYCGGPACSASSKVARQALSRGYVDVAEYKGGYPEWKSAQ